MQKINDWYHDKNGDISSKRIAGVVILSCGLLLLLAIGIMSIFKAIGDPTTGLQVGITLMSTGGTLLGIGTFEKGVKKSC